MLRLYLDEHMATAVVKAMRERGIEVQTALEARMAGHRVPDPIQLSWASVHAQTFVTGDWDFLTYGATVSPHYGVIIVPRSVSLRETIAYLELLATGYEAADVMNRVIVFPNL